MYSLVHFSSQGLIIENGTWLQYLKFKSFFIVFIFVKNTTKIHWNFRHELCVFFFFKQREPHFWFAQKSTLNFYEWASFNSAQHLKRLVENLSKTLSDTISLDPFAPTHPSNDRKTPKSKIKAQSISQLQSHNPHRSVCVVMDFFFCLKLPLLYSAAVTTTFFSSVKL